MLFFRVLHCFQNIITFVFTVLYLVLSEKVHFVVAVTFLIVSAEQYFFPQSMVPYISEYINLKQSCEVWMFTVLSSSLLLLAHFCMRIVKTFFFWVFLIVNFFLPSYLNMKGIFNFLSVFYEVRHLMVDPSIFL